MKKSALFFIPFFLIFIQITFAQRDSTKTDTLSEVSVTSIKKKPILEMHIDKMVVNVEQSNLSTGNNVLDILQRIPGVVIDPDGTINMRGKAGITIMIDGKLTYLSGEQLTSLLRSIQGNAVRSIELITNPSAKYDAAGTAGIINILLKKNEAEGFNGNIGSGFGYGKFAKNFEALSLSYRKNKWNLFGNYNYDQNKKFRDLYIERLNKQESANTYFDGHTYAVMKERNNSYKAGADYYLNDKNVMGILVNGYFNQGNNVSQSTTDISSQPLHIDSTVATGNPTDKNFRYTAINLNFQSKIDSLGQQLNVDMDYADFRNKTANFYDNHFYDQDGMEFKSPYLFRSHAPTAVRILSLKIDYSYPVKKNIELSGGFKSSDVKTDNDMEFENLNSNLWQNHTSRSNRFLYTEHIHAVYTNMKMQYKFAEIQVGLRGELTYSKGNSVTRSQIITRNYFNLFPSIYIKKELSANHTWGISYTRRIDRPNYANLNPFEYNFDLYTLAKGNPYLQPQYTDVLEINYSFKEKLFVSANYSATDNVITEVTLPDTINKTLYVTKENLAQQKTLSLNAYYPLRILEWWKINNNLNVFYNKFSTPNLLGNPFVGSRTSFGINIGQVFTTGKTSTVEMSFFYNSKKVNGSYLINPMYSMDIGVQKSFLDKKLSLSLAANDLFNWRKEKVVSAIEGQQYTIHQKYESRIFRASLIYKFGSQKIHSSRTRLRSAETEESRVQ